MINRKTLPGGIKYYTATFFHLPFLKKNHATIVIAVSATGIDMNTPVGPMSKYIVSR